MASRTPGQNNGNSETQAPSPVQGARSGPVSSNSNQPQQAGSANRTVPVGNGNSARAGAAASNSRPTGRLGSGILGATGNSRCTAIGGSLSGLHGISSSSLAASLSNSRSTARGGTTSGQLGTTGGSNVNSSRSRRSRGSVNHRMAVADLLDQACLMSLNAGADLPLHLQPESMALRQLQQQAFDLNMGVLQHQLNQICLNSAPVPAPAATAPVLAPAASAPVLASTQAQAQQVPRQGDQELDETNVYVSHLPRTMSVDEFLSFMSRFGTVISCRVLCGRAWESRGVKGVGFARMANAQEAAIAIQAVNGLEIPGHDFPLRARLAFKTNRDTTQEAPRNGQEQVQDQANQTRSSLSSQQPQGGAVRAAAPASRSCLAAPAAVGPRLTTSNNARFLANQANQMLGNNLPIDINALTASYFQHFAPSNAAGVSGSAGNMSHGLNAFGGILAPLPSAGPNNYQGYGMSPAPNMNNFGGIGQYMNGAQGPGVGSRQQQQQGFQNPGFQPGMGQDMQPGGRGRMF